MKKICYFCLAACLILTACSKTSSFVMEIPELTQGSILLIHATPSQIEAGLQDTLAFAEFDNGRFETSFDTLQFSSDHMDCSVIIRTKDGKFACNLPLPLSKGKTTKMKIEKVSQYMKGEGLLKSSYSGNKYAESFSDFFVKLVTLTETSHEQQNASEQKKIQQQQVLLYKDFLNKYPSSGLAYSLLIGQVLQANVSENNPITDYCSELCLDIDYENAWAEYLSNVMKDRRKKALSSSVLSFSALDADEKTITERDIKPYEYVLVCFWASWCKPCREELPLLKQLYKEYNSKGLEIVSISVDTNPAEWLEFVKQNPLPWLSLIGNGRELTSRYDFEMIPMNMIADKEGRIIKRDLFKDDIRKAVSELFDK